MGVTGACLWGAPILEKLTAQSALPPRDRAHKYLQSLERNGQELKVNAPPCYCPDAAVANDKIPRQQHVDTHCNTIPHIVALYWHWTAAPIPQPLTMGMERDWGWGKDSGTEMACKQWLRAAG